MGKGYVVALASEVIPWVGGHNFKSGAGKSGATKIEVMEEGGACQRKKNEVMAPRWVKPYP